MAAVDRKIAEEVLTTELTARVLIKLVVAKRGTLGVQGSTTVSLLPKYISILSDETVSAGIITEGK